MKRPPRKSARSKRGSRAPDKTLLRAISEMDPTALAELLQAVGFGDEAEERSALELLDRFLDLYALNEPDNDELSEICGQLASALDEIRISANGGGKAARQEREEILQRLDETVEEGALQGAGFMMLSRILTESGWPTPERLKQAAMASLDEADARPLRPEQLEAELTSAMADMAEQLDGDPIALHAQLSGLLGAFPSALAAQMIQGLASKAEGPMSLAMVGFALHREAVIAEAVLKGLAAISKPKVESLLVERLVRIRPWLHESRHDALDAAIRALRPSAGAPVSGETAELRRVGLTVCDGLGAYSLQFAMRRGRVHGAIAVLVKPQGVTEILFMEEIGKARVDEIFEAAKSTTAWSATDLEGAQKMLSLALGDNVANNIPPPYELVGLVERLGLGRLAPVATSPAEIAREICGERPALGTDGTTLAHAYSVVVSSVLIDSWFEAGEIIEDLLAPIKTKKRQVEALLKSFLPRRRDYWARICALSALALRGPAAHRAGPYSLELALLACDIASDKPIEDLPLMRSIAERTADAFRYQAGR